MLYKYCGTDVFDILINSRLKASRVNDFNDPFDLAFGMDEDTAFERIKSEFNGDPRFIERWLREFVPVIKSAKKAMNENFGITCFSKRYDIFQMWSHYADNHRGIVVGLNESKFVDDTSKLVEVGYSEDMVMLPYSVVITCKSQTPSVQSGLFRLPSSSSLFRFVFFV